MFRQCSKCNLIKEISSFSKDRQFSIGYKKTCKECSNILRKNRSEISKKKQLEYNRNWTKKNIHWSRKRRQNYESKRYNNDPNFKLTKRLRSRLRVAVHGNSKRGSAVRDLGCTINELKQYLESKFQSGMTWDNYGYYGWHVDHIIPLVNFDLTDREQFLKACYYTNLQPLWAKDNISKGKKLWQN